MPVTRENVFAFHFPSGCVKACLKVKEKTLDVSTLKITKKQTRIPNITHEQILVNFVLKK